MEDAREREKGFIRANKHTVNARRYVALYSLLQGLTEGLQKKEYYHSITVLYDLLTLV